MVKVSVLMITYNHEKYIEEAIESVLMQKTNFKYELVIAEDCSTDTTRSIVLDYQRKFPDIIRVKLQETNVGVRKNAIDAYKMPRGEFVAILEADDYWIDENKLQKQADFLDNNPDCSLCGHSFKRYSEVQGEFLENKSLVNTKFDLEDYLADNLNKEGERQLDIQGLTVMFRKSVLDNPPDIWEQVPYTDYLSYILCLEKGKGALLEDIMGVYRLNPNSITQGGESYSFLELMIEVRELVREYLSEKYKRYISKDIERIAKIRDYYHTRNIFESGEKNERIMDYFKEKQFANIAIYGMGAIGRKLIEILKNTNTEVKFVIDKVIDTYDESLVNLEQLNKDMIVDAIIITPIYEIEKITELILKKGITYPIIPVNDICD